MKTYTQTKQGANDVFFDETLGHSFEAGSHLHAAMLDEIARGQAVIAADDVVTKRRRAAYASQGLTTEDWIEAIVESLGSSKAFTPGQKFKDMWTKRESVRTKIPKSQTISTDE